MATDLLWEKYNKDGRIVDLSLLSLCKEALVLHIKGANYICHMWRSSCIALMKAPTPSLHSWADDFSVDWMETPFPDDVTSLLSCDDYEDGDGDSEIDVENNCDDLSDDDEEI